MYAANSRQNWARQFISGIAVTQEPIEYNVTYVGVETPREKYKKKQEQLGQKSRNSKSYIFAM